MAGRMQDFVYCNRPAPPHLSTMVPLLSLFLLLIGLPLFEIYVLIEVGRAIGALPTIALVVFTAVAGTWLVRAQGVQTVARLRTSLNQGELPATTVIEAFILLVVGVLLLLPGFATDAVGLILLVPPVRRALATALTAALLRRRNDVRTVQVTRTLEGEYRVHDDS
jgi:UPF0716 protein FxsA